MVINISNYPVFMRLGYYPAERVCGQEVLVSAQIELAPEIGSSDQLDTTVDYTEVLGLIDKILGNRKTKLIEHAVWQLGEALLTHLPLIFSATIRIEKPLIPNGIAKGAHISVQHTFHR